ncbi:MAG: hypothetical protein JXR80_04710 [Deltaproteobacteria bacterium]|nr:hypothetical protein [Deltaproteobacteria bacterium]
MVEHLHSATLNFLRHSRYDLELPFSLLLPAEQEGGDTALVCHELLRLIPGKRMVCAALWGEKRVVVKLFLDRHKSRRHWRRELQGVKALAAAGIATPPLLFAGRILSGTLPIIIFTELQPATTLLALWSVARDADGDSASDAAGRAGQVRRGLLGAVLAAIAEHHQCGLLQSDIHWSNFLFSENQVFTIDGDAVDSRGLGRELGREKSLHNIALFLAEPYPGIDRELGFIWQSYCRSRNWLPEPGEVERLQALLRHCRRQKAEKYAAKSQRNCTDFAVFQDNRSWRSLNRRYQGPDLDELLTRPDEFMAAGEVLKAGNSATVVKLNYGDVPLPEGVSLVVKRYNIKNFKHALSRCWRPSRALVSWQNAQRLSWWRIATPKPVAVLEKRKLGLRSTACFISEYVAGSNALVTLLRSDSSAQEIAFWLAQFAVLLQQLLDAGLSHGDFKATNFLCGADRCLYLLDLDAMRYWPRLGPAYRKAVERDHRRLLQNWRAEPELERAFQKIIENLRMP